MFRRPARSGHPIFTPLVVVASCALGAATGCSRGTAPGAAPLPTESVAGANGRVSVTVDGSGYHPATIRARAGQALTVVFTRTSDEGCGQQLAIPSMNIQRDLPLNQAVEVTLTPTAGTIAFTCGMNMYRGSIVVQ